MKWILMIWDIHLLKLSAVRKVPETDLFQAHGIIETLGSIISHGTYFEVRWRPYSHKESF